MEGRFKNTSRNVVVGVVCKCCLLGMAFVVRTLFIRLLGAEYTGVNGLFTDILSVLNLAEFGMGSVLMYELYEPLKTGDREKICSLVYVFGRIYLTIGVGVLAIGLMLIPFLPYIVNCELEMNQVVVFYCLYLFDTVSSYFVAQRATLITADQKGYLRNIAETVSRLLLYVCQGIYLYLTRDFLGYLLLQLLRTVAVNVWLHRKASKIYPFLRERQLINQKLVDKRNLVRNVKATFLAKVSNTILNQTDSIIISVMVGTIAVGYYSVYHMLLGYISSIYSLVVTGIEASLGNLIAEGDIGKSREMFKRIFLVITVMNTVSATVFLCVIQDFIVIWVGKDYLLSTFFVGSVLFSFLVSNIMVVTGMYRLTMGLFKEVQYIFLIMAVLNVVLSVLFGKIWGTAGIILATGVSRLATGFWYEARVVLRKIQMNGMVYLNMLGKCLVCVLFSFGLGKLLCFWISLAGIFGVIVKSGIAVLVSVLVIVIMYGRDNEWKWIVYNMKELLSEKLKR